MCTIFIIIIITGNTLFTQYSQFQDIINVRTRETTVQPTLFDHDYTDDCAEGDRHGSAAPVGASSTTVLISRRANRGRR